MDDDGNSQNGYCVFCGKLVAKVKLQKVIRIYHVVCDVCLHKEMKKLTAYELSLMRRL